MKPSREEREELRRLVIDARAGCALRNAEIAAVTGVDPGQVSKICRGRFETVSDSLVRICNVLGVPVSAPPGGRRGRRAAVVGALPADPVGAADHARSAAAWRRLERSVRRAWDSTPEGAARLARVLDAVADVTGAHDGPVGRDAAP